MPDEVYRRSQEIARRRKISFNQLVQEALQRVVEEDQDREMYEAATILGIDREESDVEFAFAAQSEVITRDEA
jgi:hypothetical protein